MNQARIALLFGLAAPLLAGCAKATKEDCAKVYDQLIKFETEGQPAAVVEMTKQIMKGKAEEEFTKECEGKASKSEVQCFLDAKTKAEYEKCKGH